MPHGTSLFVLSEVQPIAAPNRDASRDEDTAPTPQHAMLEEYDAFDRNLIHEKYGTVVESWESKLR